MKTEQEIKKRAEELRKKAGVLYTPKKKRTIIKNIYAYGQYLTLKWVLRK